MEQSFQPLTMTDILCIWTAGRFPSVLRAPVDSLGHEAAVSLRRTLISFSISQTIRDTLLERFIIPYIDLNSPLTVFSPGFDHQFFSTRAVCFNEV